MAELRTANFSAAMAANPSAIPLDSAKTEACDAAATEQRLPSFFVVGPPRTGSSWIYEVLGSHALLPGPAKETRFFDTHFERGLKWYRAHYADVQSAKPMGEVAPTYFVSSMARERMAEIVPGAKIVCVFRNPVERLISLYRLKSAYGLIRGSFEHALQHDPELAESSAYSRHLMLWRSPFGEDKVLSLIYDDLCCNPQAFTDALVDFVGIPRFTLSPAQLNWVHASEEMTHPRNYRRTRGAMFLADWCKARRLDRVVAAVKQSPLKRLVLGGGPGFAKVSSSTSRRLYEKLRPEVDALENMLGRDLSAWKSAA